MITYQWIIKNNPEAKEGLRVNDMGRKKNVITQIDFQLVATDEVGRTGCIDAAFSPPTDALDDGWTTFSKLKEATIIGWLEACPVAELWKSEAAGRIDQSEAARIVSPPWAK